MWWLWLRRAVAWLTLIAVSAAYWIKLAPFLHTGKQIRSAVVIYIVVFFATVWAVTLLLRLKGCNVKR